MSGFKWSLQNGDLAAVKGVIEGVRITLHHHDDHDIIYIAYIDNRHTYNSLHTHTLFL